MSLRRSTPLLFLLLLFAAPAAATLKSELLELQGRSPDGVVAFDNVRFARFAVGKSRPYSVVFLLVAEKLIDKPKLHLRSLRKEFGLAAKAYRDKYPAESERAGKVFFATLEVDETPEIFRRLKVDGLPFVFRLAPHFVVEPSGDVAVPEEERMSFELFPRYPWKAEAFAEFVLARTGVASGEIQRSDFLASRLSIFFVLLFLGSTLWAASRLYQSPLVRNRWIWMIGAVVVCWFSTSGGMYNIIRNVPFAMPVDGKIRLFYPGNGQQFGAEGFIMGTHYVLFSAAILLLTYGPRKVASPTGRRLMVVTLLGVALFFVRQVVYFYALKTGYHLQQYMF